MSFFYNCILKYILHGVIILTGSRVQEKKNGAQKQKLASV